MRIPRCWGPIPAPSHRRRRCRQRHKYDLVGNLKEVTDPLGRVTNLTYDLLDRVKQVEQLLTNGARPTIKYGDDGIDQVATVTDPRNLETHYSVDGLGNRSELGSPDTGLTKSTYDAAGNLKTRMDGRGKTNTGEKREFGKIGR
nr:RHS repeat domain-containing protein [Massilia frigida]